MARNPQTGEGLQYSEHGDNPAWQSAPSTPKFSLAFSSAWINTAIIWIGGLIAFFVPFVFADWTVEYIRYNKSMVVILGALLIALLWAVKIVLDKEVRLKKTIVDLPIIAMLGASTLALVMSKISSQSLWGAFPNFEDGFVLLVSFIVIFYALINHIRNGKDWLLLLGMLMSSAALLGVISILQYLGVYVLPFSVISNSKLFTPFGTMHQLALFLAVLLPLATGFWIGSFTAKRWVLTALITILFVTSVMVLGIVDYWQSWLLGAVGILLTAAVAFPVLEKTKRNLIFVPLGLFLLGLLVFKIPAIKDNIKAFNTPVPKPITLSISSSFAIAKESVKKYALAGVGEGNYGYAFKVLRPNDFNQKTDWLLNYNRPYNQFFLNLTTMGLVGLAALLFFTIRIIGLSVKALLAYAMKTDSDPAVLGLFVSVITYFGILLLNWETIPLQILFWILLVLAVYIGFEPEVSGITGDKVFSLKLATEGQGKQRDFLSLGAAVAIIVVVAGVGYKVVSAYGVDINLRKAIDAGNDGDVNTSLIYQNKVVTASETRDHYLRGVAILLHNQGVASEVSTTDETQRATDIERKRAYFREAVRFARMAADKNGEVSENWEVLLGIYSTLADYGINKIDQVPLDNLMAEIRTRLSVLTPSEVTWRLRVSNYFIKQGDNDSALTLLGQANVLKTNLVDIHYLAAKAFGAKLDYANAIVEANIALRSLNADHAWATELNDLVTTWKAAQAKAAATTTTPTTTTTTPTTTTTTP